MNFEKVECEHCGGYLRARQKKIKDFGSRKLHIKCWKELGCPRFEPKYSGVSPPNDGYRGSKKISTDGKGVEKMDNWKIHFGKYKGETFKDLLIDKEYCLWILSKKNFKNELLISYLKYHLENDVNDFDDYVF